MSDNGPVRRRRIAGESKPATPAKKTPAKKVVRKPVPRAAAAAPPASPPRSVTPPAAKVTPARTPKTAPVASSSEPARERRQWDRRLVIGGLVAAVVLALGAVYAVRGISEARSGGDDLASAQRDASDAAGRAAETIFSYRFDQLDDHLKTSKALMTPKFRKEFDKVAPGLTSLAPQRKIVVKAVTQEAAPLGCGDECSDSKVNVLVFVDQARLIGDSTQPTVFGNRITVSMVDRDGTWLVDDIRAL